ncbi:MAG: hypothetical protein ACTSUQ_07970 [Candidatus Freyarchaeota archaeon]
MKTKEFVAILVGLVLVYFGVLFFVGLPFLSYTRSHASFVSILICFFFPLPPYVTFFFIRSFWYLRESFEVFDEAWDTLKNYIREGFKQKRLKVISVPLGYVSSGIVFGFLFALVLYLQEPYWPIYLLTGISVSIFNAYPSSDQLLLLFNYFDTKILVPGVLSILAAAAPAFAFMVLGLFNETFYEKELKNLK